MAPTVLLGLLGIWLLTQATIGRLGARLLSYREVRPGEVPTEGPAGSRDPAGPPAAQNRPSSMTSTLWVWPVRGTVTGIYGEPRAGGRRHAGIDIAAPTGTPVVSASAGAVRFVGWQTGFGNTIEVDHGNGLVTLYAHLERTIATRGLRVGAGDVIGRVGSTGRSTGPHLHLEVRRDGRAVDPGSVIGGSV